MKGGKIQREGGDRMIISREKVTTTTEKISIRLDDSKALILLDKEKETEAISAIIEAAERALNLNSTQE